VFWRLRRLDVRGEVYPERGDEELDERVIPLSPIAVMEPGMTGVLEPVRVGFGDILAGVKDGWFSRSLQCWV